MERRPTRVSEAQWNIILEFLEQNPSLARGYNNSSRGRATSTRLWGELTALLNAEGSGVHKSAKNWSTYVSNYKSKLKGVVTGINSDASGTGGGPPQGGHLSDIETRFLAIMGPGFGQTAPLVRVNPFPNVEQQQPSPQIHNESMENPEDNRGEELFIYNLDEGVASEQQVDVPDSPHHHQDPGESPPPPASPQRPSSALTPAPSRALAPAQPGALGPAMPRRARQPRYRSRPLAPLDEARRILSQVELQRAAADAASARALELIGLNLGRLADVVEPIGQNLGRLTDAVEQFLNRHN